MSRAIIVGPEPCVVVCPNCKAGVTTVVTHKASTKTHIIALLLCLLCCCLCAPILYCTKCARDAEHRCPSCKAYIGTYER